MYSPMKPFSRPTAKHDLSSLKVTDKTRFGLGGSILGRVSIVTMVTLCRVSQTEELGGLDGLMYDAEWNPRQRRCCCCCCWVMKLGCAKK